MSVLVTQRGYCYLAWFDVLNQYGLHFDLESVSENFGRYPKIRAVLGFMYMYVTHDYPIPGVRVADLCTYHVDTSLDFVLISDLLKVCMCSEFVVGGDVMDDACIKQAQNVRRLNGIMQAAGMDANAVMGEAARQYLKASLKEEGSLVRSVLNDKVVDAMGYNRKSFFVEYSLTSAQLAQLQSDYPSLHVVSRGTVNHPHAFAAAARLCVEEYLFRLMNCMPGSPVKRSVDKFCVVDIGGNYVRRLKDGRLNVHNCTPIIDLNDSKRETERSIQMLNMVTEAKLSRELYVACVNGYGIRCKKLAQDCKVRASLGLLVHSQYNVTNETLMSMCDSHEFRMLYSVILYDEKVIYKNDGVIEGVNCVFKKDKEKIKFCFVQDPSLGYIHDFNNYMRIVTASVLVSPCGRVYVVERMACWSGQLVLKYTLCENAPLTRDLEVTSNYWCNSSDKVVVTSWVYSDEYFQESRWRTGANDKLCFKRVFLEVPRRLYELLEGHCIRSGDKSFNINEIYSAALSFNSRMTINGQDIHAPERIPNLMLLQLVTAVYCIVFRERYLAGKTIEAFTSQEKHKRACRKIGLTDVCSYLWRSGSYSVLSCFSELYNNVIKHISDNRRERDLNFCMLDSIKCIEITDVLSVYGAYDSDVVAECASDVYKLDVKTVICASDKHGNLDVCLKAAIDTAINLVAGESVKGENDRDSAQSVNMIFKTKNKKNSVSEVKKKKHLPNVFHRSVNSISSDSELNESAKSVVRESKVNINYECVYTDVIRIKGNGHCAFLAMKYYIQAFNGVNELVFRRLFALRCDEVGADECARVCRIMTGGLDGHGTTDHLTIFSKWMNVVVCVHGVVDENSFCTKAYSAVESVKMAHFRWYVAGTSGHVDVIRGAKCDLSVEMYEYMTTADYEHDVANECLGLVDLVVLIVAVRKWYVNVEKIKNTYLNKYVQDDYDAAWVSMDEYLEMCNVGLKNNCSYVISMRSVTEVQRVLNLGNFKNKVMRVDWSECWKSESCVLILINYCDEVKECDPRCLFDMWVEAYVDRIEAYKDHGLIEMNDLGAGEVYLAAAGFRLYEYYDVIDSEVSGMSDMSSENDSDYVSVNEKIKLLSTKVGVFRKFHVGCSRMSARLSKIKSVVSDVCDGFNEIIKDVSQCAKVIDGTDNIGRVSVDSEPLPSVNVDLKYTGVITGKKAPNVRQPVLSKLVDGFCPESQVGEALRYVSDRNKLCVPGEHVYSKNKTKVHVKTFGVIGTRALSATGVAVDKDRDVKLNVTSDVQFTHSTAYVSDRKYCYRDVSVQQECVVGNSGVRNFRPNVVNVCSVGVQCNFDSELCMNVMSESVDESSCVIESVTESVDSLCDDTTVSSFSVGNDDLVAFSELSNERCDGSGLEIRRGDLDRARIVMHFIHDWRDKSYGGFAKTVMNDCKGYRAYAERRKLGTLTAGCMFITKGNKFEYVLNIVSNVEMCWIHLQDVLMFLDEWFVNGAEIHTVALGAGLWKKPIAEAIECFSLVKNVKYIMHINDENIYNSAFACMKSSEDVIEECCSVSECGTVSSSVTKVSLMKRIFGIRAPISVAEVALDVLRSRIQVYSYTDTEDRCITSTYLNFLESANVCVSVAVREKKNQKKLNLQKGIKHYLGLSDRACYSDVVKDMLRVSTDVCEMYCSFKASCVIVLVVIDESITLMNGYKRFFDIMNEWYVVGCGPRVGLDTCVSGTFYSVNDLELLAFLNNYWFYYCLYFYRGHFLDGLTSNLNECEKKKNNKYECDAFPALSIGELGFKKSPDYFSGNYREVNFMNAMIEFRHSTQLADSVNAVELKNTWMFLNSTNVYGCLDYLKEKKMNVYDNSNRVFVYDTDKEYMYGFVDDSYVKFNESLNKFETESRYVLVSDKTRIMINQKIYNNLKSIDVTKVIVPSVEWVNGCPGCGKTSYIVRNHDVCVDGKPKDLVLCMTREGINDIRKRVAKMNVNVDNSRLMKDYRTVDSVLANGVHDKYERVFVDEALMMHAGVIGFLTCLTRCKKIVIIGDKRQIPYIDRDHVCKMKYVSPENFTSVTKQLNCTYRCPIGVAYVLRKYYDGIYSESKIVKSMKVKALSGCVIPKQADTLYVTHFQADKDWLLSQGYGACKNSSVSNVSDVMKGSNSLTTHEAQGLTYKHVIAVRRSAKDLMLYSSVEHAIVMISRHTESFVYYTDVEDVVTRFVREENGVDEMTLKNWNSVNKLSSSSAGLYISGMYGYDRLSYGANDDLVAGLPHYEHVPYRPVLLNEAYSDEYRCDDVKMKYDRDVSYLQQFYNDKMDGVNECEYGYDQEIIEMADLVVSVDKISLSMGKGPYIPSKFGKLKPKLRTIISATRKPSQRESLLGMAKRNLNAPKLANDNLDPKVLGKLLFDNFVKSCVSEEKMSMFEKFGEDVVDISPDLVHEWLDKQPPSTIRTAVSELPLHLRAGNNFSFMVKSAVKPALETSASHKYASVQTIAYNSKDVNVVFCPILNLLRDRMLAVLKDKILVNTGMSVSDFEREFNKRVNVNYLNLCKQAENDISKYDKAQAEALWWFEKFLYKALGMSDELLEIWAEAHKKSRVNDRVNGVKIDTEFQRKSGDASTFFGNTMVLLAVLAACYDFDLLYFLILAGDDSVMWFLDLLLVCYDPSRKMADLFNLECKLLNKYQYSYFCSKVLISVNGWMYVVPDLLKLITKFGRRDMVNWEHVEEYRVSCMDVIQPYRNESIAEALGIALCERYKGEIVDIMKVLRIVVRLVSNPVEFAGLFVDEGDLPLCRDFKKILTVDDRTQLLINRFNVVKSRFRVGIYAPPSGGKTTLSIASGVFDTNDLLNDSYVVRSDVLVTDVPEIACMCDYSIAVMCTESMFIKRCKSKGINARSGLYSGVIGNRFDRFVWSNKYLSEIDEIKNLI